jgi:hypothetical protein
LKFADRLNYLLTAHTGDTITKFLEHRSRDKILPEIYHPDLKFIRYPIETPALWDLTCLSSYTYDMTCALTADFPVYTSVRADTHSEPRTT